MTNSCQPGKTWFRLELPSGNATNDMMDFVKKQPRILNCYSDGDVIELLNQRVSRRARGKPTEFTFQVNFVRNLHAPSLIFSQPAVAPYNDSSFAKYYNYAHSINIHKYISSQCLTIRILAE